MCSNQHGISFFIVTLLQWICITLGLGGKRNSHVERYEPCAMTEFFQVSYEIICIYSWDSPYDSLMNTHGIYLTQSQNEKNM